MDSDYSGLTTFVLDTQFVGYQAEAVGRFLPDRLHTLASHAERLINRCHVTDPAFDAEDAVQDALLQFWKAARDGRFAAIETGEALFGLLVHTLRQEVLDERQRELTSKRGGSLTRRPDADLEAICSYAISPEEQALAEESVEAWMRRLYERDPVLRVIAARRGEGFSCREIAAELGLAMRAVEYGLSLIKAVLARRVESD